MFFNTLSMENSKLYRRKLLWIEMGILAFLVLSLFLITLAIGTGSDSTFAAMAETMAWPGGLLQAVAMAGGSSMGGYLAIILVAVATGQEYGWRTMHLWLSRGTSRTSLLAAKFASFLLPLLLIVVTALLAGVVGSMAVTYQVHGTLTNGSVDYGNLALNVLYTAYTLLPYVAITFFVTVLTRSTAAGLGITIAFSLMIEGLVAQILAMASPGMAKLAQFLPAKLSQGLLQSTVQAVVTAVDGQAFVPQLLDPLPAAIGIAVYTVVFLGLAMWAFRRQDLTA